MAGKTVSRGETARYLPPVEMLQLLSEQYGVSHNEQLAGERLPEEAYRPKAEENLRAALADSTFSRKERIVYFKQKWRRDPLGSDPGYGSPDGGRLAGRSAPSA